jgi:hypothetical protein
MGRLIPAGTGLGAYKRLSVHVDEVEGGGGSRARTALRRPPRLPPLGVDE